MLQRSALYERLYSIRQSRGLRGLTLFLCQRIVRRQDDLLFERKMLDNAEAFFMDRGYKIIIIDKDNLNSKEIKPTVSQILSGESIIYRKGLSNQDILLAVVDESGKFVHHSFILFETSYKKIIGESMSSPLFGNCVTKIEMRGKGIFPRVMLHGISLLKSKGYSRAIVSCKPKNLSSIRSIEKAGFKQIKYITSILFFSKFVFQVVHYRKAKKQYNAFLL